MVGVDAQWLASQRNNLLSDSRSPDSHSDLPLIRPHLVGSNMPHITFDILTHSIYPATTSRPISAHLPSSFQPV